MPLVLASDRSGDAGIATVAVPDRSIRRAGTIRATCLEIGLVNNMPDAALRATERQFVGLLGAAAGPLDVRLRFTTLDTIARGRPARAHLDRRYEKLEDLLREGLDALIVTGCEPRAPLLPQEPYWSELAGLVDWAERNTLSTIWSCLAAHAAVLHLDGVERQRLPEKRFGLFGCARASEHPLLEGTSARISVPHSRWNDLREGDLKPHGYQVLTRSREAGVDAFAKQWGSAFLFFQGHPEYEPDALWREYRRDMRRFASGQRERAPALPSGYLDPSSERHLRQVGADAARLAACPVTFRATPVENWQSNARGIYLNWLRQLASAKG